MRLIFSPGCLASSQLFSSRARIFSFSVSQRPVQVLQTALPNSLVFNLFLLGPGVGLCRRALLFFLSAQKTPGSHMYIYTYICLLLIFYLFIYLLSYPFIYLCSYEFIYFILFYIFIYLSAFGYRELAFCFLPPCWGFVFRVSSFSAPVSGTRAALFLNQTPRRGFGVGPRPSRLVVPWS